MPIKLWAAFALASLVALAAACGGSQATPTPVNTDIPPTATAAPTATMAPTPRLEPTSTAFPTETARPGPTIDAQDPGLGRAVEVLPRTHVAQGEVVDDYNTNPPTSGRHAPRWTDHGIYVTPVVKEHAVHSMEHGVMVIWYDTEDPELITQIQDFARGLESFPLCVIVTPWQMDSTIAMTTWGHILELDIFDADLMLRFSEEYRGNVGPEAGICWRAPVDPGPGTET
jgi:hypothetical protein